MGRDQTLRATLTAQFEETVQDADQTIGELAQSSVVAGAVARS
jgi:hypothetical protein